ncbi:MAG: hypothetical protein IIZ67_06230 [Bacilli bacterium]|nr:hypothetical protein [Bacilli bacterium]
MNNNSLVTSLNAIREISSEIYHQYIPIIDDTTDIGAFANPIFTYPEVYNEFCNALMNRLVYTQYLVKAFNNPLKVLEGDGLPFGYAGREVYVNPAKGRAYNGADFAGLLVTYEADVKVSYHTLNCDVQYPVTFSRQDLKKAMTSWAELESFIEGLSNSLYNGAYIDEFRFTKDIVSGAYKDNKAVIETITAVSNEATAKAFIQKARELYLNFQLPSTSYNAWAKCGGAGRPVTTWTNPDDIVILIRNDIRALIDVNVLADSFNIDRSTLLGNMITVDNFDSYDDEGTKVFDGSAIVGIIADKAWFKIKTQDEFLDTFYNANNRSTQYYLNLIKMYNFSLFANGVIFATSTPSVAITEFTGADTISFAENATAKYKVGVVPAWANATITYTSGNTDYFTVAADTNDPRTAVLTGVGDGSTTLTISSGSGGDTVTKTVTVTVTAV